MSIHNNPDLPRISPQSFGVSSKLPIAGKQNPIISHLKNSGIGTSNVTAVKKGEPSEVDRQEMTLNAVRLFRGAQKFNGSNG